jgi:profilin
MSWDSYITDHLMAELPNAEGKRLSHAAIIGKEDGGVWAKDEGFPDVTDDQLAAILKGFDDPDILAQTGIKLGDKKFLAVQGDPGQAIRGRSNADGVCIKQTNTAIVIGIYGEGVQAGACNKLVEELGDYLKDSGY